ncbi:MAG: general secretion pathway protein GspK, partial [Myxococcales bacterium]|nr:general secretion pathway protein GspK [Myxococcales bacterium]
GIALLMVISAIAVLALVLIDFSNNARTHMNAGVNMRDEMRASNMADTALVMTRACMDDKAWGPVAQLRSKVDLEKLCGLLLNVFIKNRIDLPVGGLSVELEGIEGLGISKGEVEEIELKPESAYIGLAGLWCGSRAQITCNTRTTVVAQLRSLLCDPAIAPWFETERADGKKYTRAELIGNLIDWVDSDDNRINIDEANWSLAEGAGEGEDAYLRDGETRYRSKDAPFDTVEELRLIRGIDDEMFDYLSTKVSVYESQPKIDINTAGADVIASVIRANSEFFSRMEISACGEDSTAPDNVANMINAYARLVVMARNQRLMQKVFSGGFLSNAFNSPQEFQQILQNPLQFMIQLQGNAAGGLGGLAGAFGGGLGGNAMSPEMAILAQVGLLPQMYQGITQQGVVNWQGVMRSVTVGSQIFRLKVKGRVGNMTRTMVAVLKRDGQTVRTLYYREE